MPRYAPNKMPSAVKRRYFELIRQGCKGAAAARTVGVSTSCGSLWFIDAGSVVQPDRPISPRFLTQDDRIGIADGLHSGDPVKVIAARIGKSYQSVYREVARNSKLDGSYQPLSTVVGAQPGVPAATAAQADQADQARRQPCAAAPRPGQAGAALVTATDLSVPLPHLPG